MYKWRFSMATLGKGRVSFTVKANDKQTAIKKGHEKIEKMGLSKTLYWDCKLEKDV